MIFIKFLVKFHQDSAVYIRETVTFAFIISMSMAYLRILYSTVARLHSDAYPVVQVGNLASACYQGGAESRVRSCAIVETVDRA